VRNHPGPFLLIGLTSKHAEAGKANVAFSCLNGVPRDELRRAAASLMRDDDAGLVVVLPAVPDDEQEPALAAFSGSVLRGIDPVEYGGVLAAFKADWARRG